MKTLIAFGRLREIISGEEKRSKMRNCSVAAHTTVAVDGPHRQHLQEAGEEERAWTVGCRCLRDSLRLPYGSDSILPPLPPEATGELAEEVRVGGPIKSPDLYVR